MADVIVVRAEDSPTFPMPGSWGKGDIVERRPEGSVYGSKEGLPGFVRILITGAGGSLAWLQEDTGGSGEMVNRRQVKVDPAEVDLIKAQWEGIPGPSPNGGVHATYTRGQFNSKVITR